MPRRGTSLEEVLVVDFGLLGPLLVRDGARHVAVPVPLPGGPGRAGGQESAAAWEEALAILDDLQRPDAGQIRAKLRGAAPDASS